MWPAGGPGGSVGRFRLRPPFPSLAEAGMAGTVLLVSASAPEVLWSVNNTFLSCLTMKCWHCDSEAKAICVFCGRAVCAEHRKTNDYFLGYGEKHARAVFIASSATAAKVRNATWCGVCEVEYAETY